MKKGFTMIELIFVIVILGILATVAIPKIMATRTDAKVTVDTQNIELIKADIISYYTAKGELKADAADMSTSAAKGELVVREDSDGATLSQVTNGTKFVIYSTENSGYLEKCIKLDYSDDENLTITHLLGSGKVCKEVQDNVQALKIQIAGTAVVR